MINTDNTTHISSFTIEEVSNSPEDTFLLAVKISSLLEPGDLVNFKGDLGAGKTTLIKGIIQSLCKINPDEISSPTFTYLNTYSEKLTVNHFDFYRITNEEQAILMGLDEHINSNCISLVEWPERVPSIAKNPTYEIEIAYTGPKQRSIKIQSIQK